MPIMSVKRGKRKVGFRWGGSGKLYLTSEHGVKGAYEKARKQGVAIRMSQERRGY